MNNKGFAFIQRERFLYFFAIGASLLLSFWMGYRETVINPDAICYLLGAQLIGETGIRGAMHLCGQAQWPFYSALIYAFVKISHLSYPAAGYVLNGIFSLFSVLFFVLIVKELGGSRRVVWLSALTILLSHEFNSIREYIVRDHGFWAFYLASLLLLLHYFRKPHWLSALLWSGSLIIATLFRIEGGIFLLVLPWIAFLYRRTAFRECLKSFFTLNFPLIIICFALTGWLLLHREQSLAQWGRLVEVPDQLIHGFAMMSERLQMTKSALAHYVLAPDSAKEAGLILGMVLIAWYIVSIIGNVSWSYAFLIVLGGWRKSITLTSTGWLVLGAYLGVNLIVTLGFFLEHLFLTKRYLMALSLVLMLFVPFVLDDLINQWASLRTRVLLILVSIFIFVSSVSGIIDFGYSKTYIRDAGNWLAKNVPMSANLYINDHQLMYYSEHFGYSIFEKMQRYSDINKMRNGHWKQYDYVALRLNKKEAGGNMAALLQEIHMTPVQVFHNKRGDQVVIYKNVK